MRVLFLDAYFEPEQIAFTHLEHDLLSQIVKNGHDVEIVCPIPTRGISLSLKKIYKSDILLYDWRGEFDGKKIKSNRRKKWNY